MKKSRERIVFVLMGLLVGFALGISILFWRQSLNLSQRIFDRAKEYFVGLFKSEEFKEPTQNIVIKKKNLKKKKETVILNDTLNNGDASDTLLGDMGLAESIYPDEAVWYDEYSDKYAMLNNQNNDEEIARDRLLFKKQIEAELLSKDAASPNSNTNMDSLLIGGKAPKDDKNKFTVEFWESPLNYKGYRKNKNQLVLYGIKQADLVTLKLLNNDLYLCFSDNYYALENTTDFRNLVPLANQQIINQLKGK